MERRRWILCALSGSSPFERSEYRAHVQGKAVGDVGDVCRQMAKEQQNWQNMPMRMRMCVSSRVSRARNSDLCLVQCPRRWSCLQILAVSNGPVRINGTRNACFRICQEVLGNLANWLLQNPTFADLWVFWVGMPEASS